jgi:hypothetical protein
MILDGAERTVESAPGFSVFGELNWDAGKAIIKIIF